jgi:hypothetical protein
VIIDISKVSHKVFNSWEINNNDLHDASPPQKLKMSLEDRWEFVERSLCLIIWNGDLDSIAFSSDFLSFC